MFSVRQKREIAEKVQKILRETNHPELPDGEIQFGGWGKIVLPRANQTWPRGKISSSFIRF